MKRLILIGYWHSEQEPNWPDPARFVDPDWGLEIRETVINYLNCGRLLSVYMGTSWCRFRCHKHGHAFGLGSTELTDGVYFWPDGLSHYLSAHNVRLPDEFVEHVLRQSKQPKSLKASQRLPDEKFNFETEKGWWLAQAGFTEGRSFLSPRNYIGLTVIATVPASEPNDAILNFLHRNGFVRYWRIGTQEFLDELRQGVEFTVTLSESQLKGGIQKRIQELTAQASEGNIQLKFIEYEEDGSN